MENEKEKKPYDKGQQKFYFNDEGKLIVETNKGVWVDGEPYVKMYGNFSCNAKTLGAIIQQLKGIEVEIDKTEEEMTIAKLTKIYGEEMENFRKDANKTIEDFKKNVLDRIKKYNELPWWKRMFKKVEV